MQCSCKTAQIPLPRPNTFAGLMELYETNYIKIKKLCGDFNKLHENNISTVTAGMDLHLRIVEKTKYTVTLYLTYHFTQSDPTEIDEYPGTLVRVYFDAMQAEVLRKVSKVHAKPSNSFDLYSKWRNNRFLFKWLSYSLRQGHDFQAT